MKKYCVTIVRYGYAFVEADSESEAMEIADNLKTDEVNWSDDWEATDVSEDEDISDEMCYTED